MKKVISSLMGMVALLWAGVSFACSTCGCELAKTDQAEQNPAAIEATAAFSAEATPVVAEEVLVVAEEVLVVVEEVPVDVVVTVVSAGNKICPIMGGPVSEDSPNKVEYNGKSYNLCCAGCKEAFLKDPEAALKRLAELEAPSGEAVTK